MLSTTSEPRVYYTLCSLCGSHNLLGSCIRSDMWKLYHRRTTSGVVSERLL